MEFLAPKKDRLDRLLREQSISPWMSRQAWEEALARGWVRVDGKLAKKAGQQVNEGDRIGVELPSGEMIPSPAPRLVWESEGGELGVFYKEAGLATYPLFPWESDTLANGLLTYAQARGLRFLDLAQPPSLEGGLLQRLDRYTSGLVTSAFTPEAKASYRQVFSGEVEKTYLAIVAGKVEGSYQLYFSPSSGAKVTAREKGREGDTAAELHLQLRDSSSSHSLLEVRTRQGFRHVVRAGLAALGSPLVGDALYGGSGLAPHHQLHAYALRIPGVQEICAGPPQSFLDCGKTLGLDYSE